MELILMALGACILYVLQRALYERFWKKGLTADAAFQDNPAVCGSEAYLLETVINAKFLPLSILRVKFRIGRELEFVTGENSAVSDYTYRNDVFSVFPYQKITRKLTFHCSKRGYYEIKSLDLVSHDLFFSGHLIETLSLDSHLYVYPAAADGSRLNVPFQKMMGTCLSRNRLVADPFELKGIREYQTYDSMHSVNWKATARTGALKVNVHESTATQNIFLFLNMDSDYPWASEALREEAVSICGSFIGAFVSEGIPTGFFSNGMDALIGEPSFVPAGAGVSHVTRCMEALSRLRYDIPMTPFETLMRECSLEKKAEDCLYIMISSCRRPELQTAYQEFCRYSPGSLWIAPLRPEDEVTLSLCPATLAMKWEVPYDKI
ncbi:MULTISPECIES: DUF58 domain-containing protein [Hungatella]|uniref:DUF58 domain-containing protein n=1 Tax=Hungatella TaxID=1649459 RepID=UPI0011DD50EF|nr:DUF58 domain-containing protein [Hungatella hathewayi]